MDAKITHNKKNNLWILKIQEIDLDNHKTDYKTYCYTSREEAEIVLKEKETLFNEKMNLLEKKAGIRYTFKEYLEHWYQEILPKWSNSKCAPTVYHWCIYQIIIPAIIKDILLTDVTPFYINELLNKCKETVHNCCAFMAKKCITEILYSAIAEELISTFPFDEITEYAMNSKKYVLWKQNDIECFYKFAQTGNCYLEYLLVFFLGLETGELLGLKFSNINFKEKELTICQVLVKDDIKEKIRPLSQETGYRTIKIPDLVITELKKRKKTNRFLFKSNPNMAKKWKNYVCIGERGNVKSRAVLNKWLKEYCQEANVPRTNLKDLRRLCTLNLLEDGNSLEFIANQLHYSSVLSIMEIYCNFLEKDETHENSRLDSVVFSANDSI